MNELDELRDFPGTIREPDLDAVRVPLDLAIAAELDGAKPSRPRLRALRWLAVPAIAAALSLGTVILITGEDATSSELAAPATLSALFGSGEDRYLSAESPGELATMVEADAERGALVLDGVVKGFQEGRTFGVGFDYAEDPGMPTVVMAVAVSETLGGELPTQSDGTVYVEFDGSLSEPLAESLPPGTETVMYLNELGPGGLYPGVKIANDGAGHPDDQPLYRVFSPQGFYLATEADGVVQPQEGMVYPDATLDDFEPSSDEFPPGQWAQ